MCCIVLQEQLKQIQESKSKHFPRRSPATWVIISPAQAATADDKNPASERNLVRAQSVAARTLRKCTQMPRKTSIQRRRSRSVHNLAPNGNTTYLSLSLQQLQNLVRQNVKSSSACKVRQRRSHHQQGNQQQSRSRQRSSVTAQKGSFPFTAICSFSVSPF